jgi:pyridoxal phosphate enzyme (YggS family)
MIDIAGNIARVRERVLRAAQRAGRAPEEVRIVAVSKTKPAALVVKAIEAGISDVGENYVQEASDKIAMVGAPVRWHLIGHLQRNKAARAVELFDVVQTLDSLALAKTLDRHGRQRQRTLSVMIEVNIGREPSKHGVDPEQTEAFVEALSKLRYLKPEGLMAIPPAVPSPELARSSFVALRRLRENLPTEVRQTMKELSMGMTQDFEVAIEEGATMVRIGRAIFGTREE